MKDKSLEEINQEFQDYQDDLTLMEKHLKLHPVFDKSSMDDIISLLDITPQKLTCKKR